MSEESSPPCVLFCVICTLFNGWSTSARFQQVDKIWFICSECEGPDRLEHYAPCIWQWRMFALRFGKSVFPATMPRFLGLYANNTAERIVHCVHMYAVKFAVDHSRASGCIQCSHDKVASLIDEGYKTACTVEPKLKKYMDLYKLPRQRGHLCNSAASGYQS